MLRKTNVTKCAKMGLRKQITNARKNPSELAMKASSPLHGIISKQNSVGSNGPDIHTLCSFGKHLETSHVFLGFCHLQYTSKQFVSKHIFSICTELFLQ